MLYGYEAWSLTLREECRLRVFENRILRIFGPKRDENGEWRRFHNEKLHSSPNIVRMIKSRRIRWAGYVARMEEGIMVLSFPHGLLHVIYFSIIIVI